MGVYNGTGESELGGAGKGAVGGLATGAAIGSAFPGIGTAIGAVAGAVIGGVSGWIKAKKARRALAEAKFNAVPEDVLETQRQANELAKTGMPAAQYAKATENIQREGNLALQAAQDRRGGLMKVSQIQQGKNDAYLGLDAENARQRRQNIEYAGRVNSVVGAYKQKRGERDWDYAMSLLGSNRENSDNQLNSGLGTLYSMGQSGAFNFGGFGRNSMGARSMSMVDAPIGASGRSPVVGGGYINPSLGNIGNRYNYLGG